jgi:chorismate synthase
MIQKTLQAAHQGDTVGGVVQVIARGVPAELGEPVFDALSAPLAHAMLSIGAARGIEFGDGFEEERKLSNENNDQPFYDPAGSIHFRTNYSGGMRVASARATTLCFG